MRGLLTGYSIVLHFASLGIGMLLFRITETLLENYYENKDIILWLLAAALSLVGFILHYVFVRWYKLRVRDEDYDVPRVVEEVYDRYLSHAPY